MSKIKILCGWCRKELGTKEEEVAKGPEMILNVWGELQGKPQYGICDDCLLHNFPHLYERVKAALEVANVEEIYKGGDQTEYSPKVDSPGR